MRGGTLADDKAEIYQPMNDIAHERHLGVPHIVKHTLTTRKKKYPRKQPTQKPAAAYTAHVELSQLLSPDNYRQQLQLLEAHRSASDTPKPPTSFQRLVEDFKMDNPYFMNRKYKPLPETMAFFSLSQLDPGDFFLTKRSKVNGSITQPLHAILERTIEKQPGRTDLETNYEKVMEMLLSQQPVVKEEKAEPPPTPPQPTPRPDFLPSYLQMLQTPSASTSGYSPFKP